MKLDKPDPIRPQLYTAHGRSNTVRILYPSGRVEVCVLFDWRKSYFSNPGNYEKALRLISLRHDFVSNL